MKEGRHSKELEIFTLQRVKRSMPQEEEEIWGN